MARRLRMQFPGARYHVINRGNLQHDLFVAAGARRSFAGVKGEACEKLGGRMHAYIVMRNHFHFALETPEPNLVAGMHWLQTTFAVRLLRFHGQHGHVFQGRYKSPVIQDDAHLARVCDYIHLKCTPQDQGWWAGTSNSRTLIAAASQAAVSTTRA